MPSTLPKPIRVRDAGDLYAAIPHLMGFHPADSLVVLVLKDHLVSMTMRVDLPRPRHRGLLAAQLEGPLQEHGASEVILVVVCPPSEHMPEELPHEPLVTALRHRLGGVDIEVVEAVWLPSCQKDAQWLCYLDIDCHGTLPDPQLSAVAAASAHEGNVTFESRAAMAAILTLDPPEALERRSMLLDELMTSSSDADPCTELRRVSDAIDAVEHRKGSLPDKEIAALAKALAVPEVRDASMGFAAQPRSRLAERLWLELTRACPAPERAEPACLLAFYAYQRGDGGIASIALDVAEEACPGHALSKLVRAVVSAAFPPSEIRELSVKYMDSARELLAGTQSSSGRSQS
ncbi:protein of unknown function [Lentzea albidocapillata subsp. violacea]|uniref:DUF4192 domain-containing protein n=1 Tax=Lentzea albidocapillata subsp. violacea TaxID=128104 RepID=A0A1G9BUN9_9PSEU|nr:DUF4192 domain-containing protein [Lentzea albidocapillata]SDK42864.1 protein of unknown function [Lentzea albidocapillata subsp. violacea]